MDVLGNEKASFSSSSHRHRARARLAPREHPPVGNEVMDFAMTSRTEAATEADASFGMEDTPAADLYGFGTLVSPILSLPFAKTNQMEWKFKANLVGEKILNPAIFLCDHCNLPILIYGRMVCDDYPSYELLISFTFRFLASTFFALLVLINLINSV